MRLILKNETKVVEPTETIYIPDNQLIVLGKAFIMMFGKAIKDELQMLDFDYVQYNMWRYANDLWNKLKDSGSDRNIEAYSISNAPDMMDDLDKSEIFESYRLEE